MAKIDLKFIKGDKASVKAMQTNYKPKAKKKTTTTAKKKG